MIASGTLHYYAELALWMVGFYLAGCPLGALARRLFKARRGRVSGGS